MTETGLMTLLQQVLDEASVQVGSDNGSLEGLDEANLKARMAFQALSLAEARRRNYRAVQARIIVQIMRESEESGPLWLAYPPTDEYPQGFGTLKEFLFATGIGKSTVYALDNLAKIVPEFDRLGIPIEPYITKDKYPVLAAVTSLLRRTLDGEETGYDVQEILGDVQQASNRDAVRAKYCGREDKVGAGAVHYLDDGRAVVILVLQSTEDVGTIVPKLTRVIGWDELVATVVARRRSIRVVIDDP